MPFASRRTARCTPAATTCTPRGSSGAARLLAPAATSWRRRRVHVPARRGGLRRRAAHDRGGGAGRGGPRVDAAYGLHVLSHRLPAGRRSPGPARSWRRRDGLFVTVRGAGGHGSTPHQARDPMPAACEMVTALQTTVTRAFDRSIRSCSPSGRIHGGTQAQHHPRHGDVRGDRAHVHRAVRQSLADVVRRVCEGIAAAHGRRRRGAVRGGVPRHGERPGRGRVRAAASPRTCSAPSARRAHAEPDHRLARTSRGCSPGARAPCSSSGRSSTAATRASAPSNHSPQAALRRRGAPGRHRSLRLTGAAPPRPGLSPPDRGPARRT